MITNLSFYIKDFLTKKVVGFAHTREKKIPYKVAGSARPRLRNFLKKVS